jgi:hypothetical protein
VAHNVLAQIEGDRIVFQRDGLIVRATLGAPGCTVVEIAERD